MIDWIVRVIILQVVSLLREFVSKRIIRKKSDKQSAEAVKELKEATNEKEVLDAANKLP